MVVDEYKCLIIIIHECTVCVHVCIYVVECIVCVPMCGLSVCVCVCGGCTHCISFMFLNCDTGVWLYLVAFKHTHFVYIGTNCWLNSY